MYIVQYLSTFPWIWHIPWAPTKKTPPAPPFLSLFGANGAVSVAVPDTERLPGTTCGIPAPSWCLIQYLVANYPRIVSGLVHPSYKWDFCRVNPLKKLG